MTAFEIDNTLFQEYTKMKIINGFPSEANKFTRTYCRGKYSTGFLRSPKKYPS
jgi:hypothetical protein